MPSPSGICMSGQALRSWNRAPLLCMDSVSICACTWPCLHKHACIYACMITLERRAFDSRTHELGRLCRSLPCVRACRMVAQSFGRPMVCRVCAQPIPFARNRAPARWEVPAQTTLHPPNLLCLLCIRPPQPCPAAVALQAPKPKA